MLLGNVLTERILAEAKATAEELKTQGVKPALILLYAQGVSSAERYCAALKRAAKFVPVEIEAFPLDPLVGVRIPLSQPNSQFLLQRGQHKRRFFFGQIREFRPGLA